jgi:hypothetical protein
VSDAEELYSVPLGPTDGDVGARRCCVFCGVVGWEAVLTCGVVGWEAVLTCGVEDLVGTAGCSGERRT